jgi:transposase
MPKLLFARAPLDEKEDHQIRKLAGSRHAPGDWILRARMIAGSWEGKRTTVIAQELGCHPQTVRERITRFHAEGIDGLGDRPGAGRKPRLTEHERGRIIALARSIPPGRAERMGDELRAREPEKEAQWSLDALTRAAHERHPGGAEPDPAYSREGRHSVAASAELGREHRPGLCPKRARIVALYTEPPEGATILCLDELGPVSPRTFPPAPSWSGNGHRNKAPLDYGRGPDKVWVYGASWPSDGQVLTQTAASRNTAGIQALLDAVDQDNPDGEIYLIADNLSSHTSAPITEWLTQHPRVHIETIPKGACWLNLIEGW